MKQWTDIAQIEGHFKLESKGQLIDVRDELRQKLKGIHPDHTGGNFITSDQVTLYHDLSSAIEFVDERFLPAETRTLVRAVEAQSEAVGRALEKTQTAMVRMQSERNISGLIDRARTSIKKSVSSRFATQKLGGGMLAGISAFILAVKGPLEDLAGDSAIFQDPEQRAMLGLLLATMVFSGAFLALIAHIFEQREIRRKEFILTEQGFRKFLMSKPFGRRLGVEISGSGLPDTISLSELVDGVAEFMRLPDSSACQEIAELIAEKIVSRDLATRLDGPFVSPTFRLAHGLAEEVLVKSPTET